jgi:hypothetical protein
MPESDHTFDFIRGTWLSIAALAELLIDQQIINRHDLLSLLAAFEEEASGGCAGALAGLQLYINRGSILREEPGEKCDP